MVIRLLECIQGEKHITEINNNQELTHYISLVF